MNLINSEITSIIQAQIIEPVVARDYLAALPGIEKVVDLLYANIPDQQRISFGRVHTIKTLSDWLFRRIAELSVPAADIAVAWLSRGQDYKSPGVALGILSFCGLVDFPGVLPHFVAAADSESWDVREMAQMFFRKLIKKHPEAAKTFLEQLAESERPNLRRFVAETLRPVQENRWFYQQPEYPLSILRKLFFETAAYPRTSVGNNLSDLARRLPEMVYALVAELAASGDKNAYWIAYRACRNLVKIEPMRVMTLLMIDEYKYKTRIYRKNDDQRN